MGDIEGKGTLLDYLCLMATGCRQVSISSSDFNL